MKKSIICTLIATIALALCVSAHDRVVKIFKDGKQVFSSTTNNIDCLRVTENNSTRILHVMKDGETSYTIPAADIENIEVITHDGTESGMYLGIIGFNAKLTTKPMGWLDIDTEPDFISFVDGLNNDNNNTALVYAVDNAIDLLKSMDYPSDIINASIITFTDGIDNRSTLLMNKDNLAECQQAVRERIENETVSGIKISSYGIGLESAGATSTVLKSALEPLSTNGVVIGKNMSEVTAEFKRIAETLNESSNVQTLKTNVAGGYDNGCKIRFTLDIPVNRTPGSMNEQKCNSSQLYIEGIFHRKSLDNGKFDIYITDLTSKGLEFNHGDKLQAREIEINGDTRYEFTFEGVVTDNLAIINKNNILVWTGTPFIYDDEGEPNEQTDVVVKRSSAAIVLVLDCTTSLGDLFAGLQTSAKTFIETIVDGTASVPDQPEENDIKTYTVNGVSFNMIKVKRGTFIMGATPEQTSSGYQVYANESPTHTVTLTEYYIGETEVTQELWKAVMGNSHSTVSNWTASYGVGNNFPAYSISYYDCEEFITKLNQLTGAEFRMPTEAEWEYAARGGKNSKGYIFSGSNSLDNVGWYNNNSNSKIYRVAKKAPNELGIYDMSGNVWEWCSDWYRTYSSASQTNPTGPNSGTYRVMRGGSWESNATSCRISYRNNGSPNTQLRTIGLRLAQ